MTGQALSRVRNPYPEATRLERRRFHRVLDWALDVEQRVEDAIPIAIIVALVALAIDVIAAAGRGWPQQ